MPQHQRSTDRDETNRFMKKISLESVLTLVSMIVAVMLAFFNLKSDIRALQTDVGWIKVRLEGGRFPNEYHVQEGDLHPTFFTEASKVEAIEYIYRNANN